MKKKLILFCTILLCQLFLIKVCFAKTYSSETGALYQLVHRNVPWLDNKVIFQIETGNWHKPATDNFALGNQQGKLFIKANNVIAAATGLNWFLKYYCHRSISHTGNNINAPIQIPLPDTLCEIHSDYEYRYALNYCTVNYTMSFWDWPRWEKELDWMAMNGVNLMLAPLGNELIWYNVLKKMGCSDSAARSYAPGPAFTAWWLMGNLEGWEGPLSDRFMQQQKMLQQKILARCKELAIKPVVQGFYGIVPSWFKGRFPKANIINQGKWEGGFQRSAFLDPSDSLFKATANLYYQEYKNLYGDDLKFFGGDPFHEGGKTGGLDLTKSGKLIYEAAAKYYPAAVWVLQAWQGNPKKELLKGFADEQVLILDLFGESDNYWEQRKGYEGKPWLWCMVNNFGEKTGMIGKLALAAEEPMRAKASVYGKDMKGIGILPEGINNNAVLYDLLLEMAWRQQPVDLNNWIKQFCFFRYGVQDKHLEKAWQLLLQSVYSSPKAYKILGPTESVLLAKPSFFVKHVSTWGEVDLFYDTTVLRKAVEEIISVRSKYWKLETFRYDCVDICRQLLSDRGFYLYQQLTSDFAAGKKKKFQQKKNKFLKLILQQDSLCSMDPHFTLARWIDEASAIAGEDDERKQFVRNAKVQISYWGPDNDKSSLIDYAGKQWSGMLATYYYPRWKAFFAAVEKKMAPAKPIMIDPQIDYFGMEKKWTDSTYYYARPEIAGRARFFDRLLN